MYFPNHMHHNIYNTSYNHIVYKIVDLRATDFFSSSSVAHVTLNTPCLVPRANLSFNLINEIISDYRAVPISLRDLN